MFAVCNLYQKVKTFSSTCEVPKFVEEYQFSPLLRLASRFVKKKINKQIRANLKSKPMSTILDSISRRRLRFHVAVRTQAYFIRLVFDSYTQKKD